MFRSGYVSDSEHVRVSVAKTGNGDEVFIWGEHGHEPSDNGFRKTFNLESDATRAGEFTSVAAGSDGFFYSNRGHQPVDSNCPSLYEIHRGAAPVPHLPKVSNIMQVGSGPDGSLLLREGDNKAGDWGKLYWPEARRLVRLKPDLLPDITSLPRFHWLESRRTLLAFTPQEVWPIPWEELEKLPRSKVR
jgi:hypothetical protein